MVYNFFQKKYLKHNLAIYQKLGLEKKYYSPISSKDFNLISKEKVDALLADTPVKAISLCALYINASKEDKLSLDNFEKEGFAVLKNYLCEKEVNAVNEEIEKIVVNKIIKFKWNHKIMFAIHHSERIRKIGNDPKLRELLGGCIRGNAILFQSINFLQGSEQASHSDSIHMTTFPFGGLVGVWIALEDIEEDNGPLHYYPGSHILPYYMNKDYENEGTQCLIGDKPYTEYEKMIAQKVKEKGLEKKIFTAKKGDLLIWHANLFHGGEPHLNKEKTRKSMVFHYFRENAICYHEINQRPAIIKKF